MTINYYETGVEEQKKEKMLFTAVMQQFIEYKYSDMDLSCEQRAEKVIKYVRQREKEITSKHSKEKQ